MLTITLNVGTKCSEKQKCLQVNVLQNVRECKYNYVELKSVKQTLPSL